MANMTFGTNLIPASNNTYTLGNSDKKWILYGSLNNITLTPATTGFTISGGTTSKTLTVNNNYILDAACEKSYTDSSSASAISTGTSLTTERDVYYGLPTINNSHAYTSSTTIYAPTAGGTADTQALVGNGATTAPKWVNISPSISIGAGTSSAAPTVNITILGRSGTAQSITTATTGVYGVTKLQDGIASTSTALAATANAAYTASRNSLHTLATTTKFYITGSTSATTNTAGDDFDTGIYTTTIAGELSAARYSYNSNGTEKAYTYYNTTDDSIDFVFI